MKIRGITYSDENMTRSAMLCRESMLRNGVDECSIWSPVDIQPEFKQFNAEIFDGKRGAGCYWLFKPYIIYSRMLRMDEGDILIYSDAGVEFIGPVQPVIDAMASEDVFLFSNGWQHVEWCKMNSLFAMNPGEYQQYTTGWTGWKEWKQVQASNIFIRVNEKTKAFVKEWLLWCQMPGLIDDSPSAIPNYPTFADHRHDQAILTNMAYRHYIKLHWFPTETNQHQKQEGDNYPTILRHHRKRNHEWTS